MRLPWVGVRSPSQQVTQLLLSLQKLKDSLSAHFDPEQEQRLLQSSDFPILLNVLCAALLEKDKQATGDFTELLEVCLQRQVFGVLVAEALVDRPVGVFEIVVEALGQLTDGVKNQPLLANGGYCRPLSDLLEYSCAHLEQGSEHRAVLSLLLPLCRAVHRTSGYCSLFTRKQNYLPLELSWNHFSHETEGSVVRECLLYCVQTEEESVVSKFLLSPNVAQHLIFKLNSYFQSPASSECLGDLSTYAAFLDDICRLCLWPGALRALVEAFRCYFCEGVLTPRLLHSDTTLRSTCSFVLSTQYLRLIVASFQSSLLLLPLVRFLSFSGFWVCSIEAEDALVRLRCLQLLYVVLEKGRAEAVRELVGEGGRSERAMSYEEFCEEFGEWIREERELPSFSLLSANCASVILPPSTGETWSSEVSSSTGDDSQSLPSELLLLLLLKLKRLDMNTLTENLMLTVKIKQGVLSRICSYAGERCLRLHDFLMSRRQGGLGAVLVLLSKRLISVRRTESQRSQNRGSWWMFWEGPRKSGDEKNSQSEVVGLFEEFINELASILLVHQQLHSLEHECSSLSHQF